MSRRNPGKPSTRPVPVKKSQQQAQAKTLTLEDDYKSFETMTQQFSSLINQEDNDNQQKAPSKGPSKNDFIGQSELISKQIHFLILNCFKNYQNALKTHGDINNTRETMVDILKKTVDNYFEIAKDQNKAFRGAIKQRIRISLVPAMTVFFAKTTLQVLNDIWDNSQPLITHVDRFLTPELIEILQNAFSEALDTINIYFGDIYEQLPRDEITQENLKEINSIMTTLHENRLAILALGRKLWKKATPTIPVYADDDTGSQGGQSQQESTDEEDETEAKVEAGPAPLITLYHPIENWGKQITKISGDLQSLKDEMASSTDTQSLHSVTAASAAGSQSSKKSEGPKMAKNYYPAFLENEVSYQSSVYVEQLQLFCKDSFESGRTDELSEFGSLLTAFAQEHQSYTYAVLDLYRMATTSRDFQRADEYEEYVLTCLLEQQATLQELMDDNDEQMLEVGKNLIYTIRDARTICSLKGDYVADFASESQSVASESQSVASGMTAQTQTPPDNQEDNDFIPLDQNTFDMINKYLQSIEQLIVTEKPKVSAAASPERSEEQAHLIDLQCTATELIFPAYWNLIYGATLSCQLKQAEMIFKELTTKRTQYATRLNKLRDEALDHVDIAAAEQIDARLAAMSDNDNDQVVRQLQMTMEVWTDNAIDQMQKRLAKKLDKLVDARQKIELEINERLQSIQEKQHIVELKNLILQEQIDIQKEKDRVPTVVKETNDQIRELMAAKKYTEAKKLQTTLEEIKKDDLNKRIKAVRDSYLERQQMIMSAQSEELQNLQSSFDKKLGDIAKSVDQLKASQSAELQKQIIVFKKKIVNFAVKLTGDENMKQSINAQIAAVGNKVIATRGVENVTVR